jgi:hypothetical protein
MMMRKKRQWTPEKDGETPEQVDGNRTERDGRPSPTKRRPTPTPREYGRATAGIYVQGKIGGVEGRFLIDPGSSGTLLSKRSYDSITQEEKPELEAGTAAVQQADGKPMIEYGGSRMKVQIGGYRTTADVTVVEMDTDAILGMGLLITLGCVLDIKNLPLKLHDEVINTVFRLAEKIVLCLGKSVTIPPGKEVIV